MSFGSGRHFSVPGGTPSGLGVRARLDTFMRFPAWLPPEQRGAFRDRAVTAFGRWVARQGWQSLTPQARRRILGGLAAAFKCGRLDARWGRRMLSRRGTRARLRSIAMAGYQKAAYFAELGRRGGRRSAAKRRLATAHPHVQKILRGDHAPGPHWMTR
jgi:hypothetical protein